MTFTFGCYAGGLGAAPDGTITPGPPEDSTRILPALQALHGDHPFLVRGYVQYGDQAPLIPEAPPDVTRYAGEGRRIDLVATFRDSGDDLSGWLEHLRQLLRTHGPALAKLQVTEELNLATGGGDGGMPAVRRALVEGVITAREEVRRLGLDVQIGFNTAPTFGPAAAELWPALAELGGRPFAEALDYVGLDCFPDVGHPIPPDQLRDAVAGLLTALRTEHLPAAGIPGTVPIHLTEHGWGTAPDRSDQRQAEVVETVVRTVHDLRRTLNITAYEHFALRDADSTNPDRWHQLGLLRSDYTPKPAFGVYQRLIAELTEAPARTR